MWKGSIQNIIKTGHEVAPRGMKIKEVLADQITIPMKFPIVTVASRKINYGFALGEAWWIVSGSNRLSDITQFMKKYKDYSDDGFFLNGAYGVKFVDQLRYVADTLETDRDSRQAVINIWRENPRQSKDIPCTISHQYFIRDDKLHLVATMRSQDMVWGLCYDSFTFTMMAKTVQTLLRARGVEVEMGNLYINQGSAHIYEPYWDSVQGWVDDFETDGFIWNDPTFSSYESFVQYLWDMANEHKR